MRVGVVGAGWVTQYHLPAWKGRNDVELVAICDPDLGAAQARADAFGVGQAFTSLDAMLDAVRLDALDIASPRQFHAAQVRQGLAHGLAVLCQKPLGVDLAEAEALVAQLADGPPVMVHENWRFRPYYRELKRWLQQGVAGRLHAVRLDFHSSGMVFDASGQRPALVRQPMFRDLERLLVAEVLIHHLDSLRFLLGEMRLVDAHLSRSNSEIVGEDRAMLRLTQTADDVPVTVSGNLAVHGAPPAPSDQLWLYGAAGTIHLDGTTLRLLSPSPQEVAFDPARSYQAAYDGAISHFVDGVREGRPFETAPQDNLQTLRLVEAAYRSSQFQPRGPIC